MTESGEILAAAWRRRVALMAELAACDTDCWRLFHGTVEGWPGVTVDRYGETLLVQSFHQSLTDKEAEVLRDFYAECLPDCKRFAYNDRSAGNSRRRQAGVADDESGCCTELGVRYRVAVRHAGQDPLLFLDMRVGRKWLLANASGKSVLNLFAYTCGAGVAAARGGAKEVWNIDFSQSYLDYGAENAALNGLSMEEFRLIQSDFFPAALQLADLPIPRRQRRLANGKRVPVELPPYPTLEPRQFDLTFLDPPKWAKSRFGTVDLMRDYQSLFKPALLATREGGEMLVCNNVAKVALEPWLEALQRCAAKLGRSASLREVLRPDADFPSFDGQHPLKLAILDV